MSFDRPLSSHKQTIQKTTVLWMCYCSLIGESTLMALAGSFSETSTYLLHCTISHPIISHSLSYVCDHSFYIYILPNSHHPTVEYLLYIRKLLLLWLVPNLELHGEACLRNQSFYLFYTHVYFH